jgi:hypothetical protein
MRAAVINLKDRYILVGGEPILDTQEGVLILAFKDGTSRTFNWDHVIDYYYMTDEEYELYLADQSDQEDEEE